MWPALGIKHYKHIHKGMNELMIDISLHNYLYMVMTALVKHYDVIV